MQRKITGFNLVAIPTLLLSAALLAGCEDDSQNDVVLPNGQVVSFDELDIDGDGKVSESEFAGSFSGWDVNNDGFIASNEWPLKNDFATFDTDGNGELSRTEFAASFKSLDTSGDGFLESDELAFD